VTYVTEKDSLERVKGNPRCAMREQTATTFRADPRGADYLQRDM